MYKIKFNKESNAQFQALEANIFQNAVNEIQQLGLHARPVKAERLKLRDGYRLRFDHHRMVYHINEQEKILSIIQIVPNLV